MEWWQKAVILWLGLSVLWALWGLTDLWREGNLRKYGLNPLWNSLLCPIGFPVWFLGGLYRMASAFITTFIDEWKKP